MLTTMSKAAAFVGAGALALGVPALAGAAVKRPPVRGVTPHSVYTAAIGLPGVGVGVNAGVGVNGYSPYGSGWNGNDPYNHGSYGHGSYGNNPYGNNPYGHGSYGHGSYGNNPYGNPYNHGWGNNPYGRGYGR